MKSTVFPTVQLLLVWSREGSGAELPLLLKSFIWSAQDIPCAFPVGIKMQRTTRSFPPPGVRNCACPLALDWQFFLSQNLHIGNGSQETLCTIPLTLSGNSMSTWSIAPKLGHFFCWFGARKMRRTTCCPEVALLTCLVHRKSGFGEQGRKVKRGGY